MLCRAGGRFGGYFSRTVNEVFPLHPEFLNGFSNRIHFCDSFPQLGMQPVQFSLLNVNWSIGDFTSNI